MAHGRFITLEGGEGAGKTTQLRRLAAVLEAQGRSVVATREPGGSPGAEIIRRLLVEGDPDRWDAVTEALLHFAARRDHVRSRIWPALDAGAWVISDRFADSTMAYQGYGLGLGRDMIERLQALAIGGFKPDMTIILDLPVAVGLARAAARHGHETRYETIGDGFHDRLRQGFLDIARREPARCTVIDATAGVETVATAILEAVQRRLGPL